VLCDLYLKRFGLTKGLLLSQKEQKEFIILLSSIDGANIEYFDSAAPTTKSQSILIVFMSCQRKDWDWSCPHKDWNLRHFTLAIDTLTQCNQLLENLEKQYYKSSGLLYLGVALLSHLECQVPCGKDLVQTMVRIAHYFHKALECATKPCSLDCPHNRSSKSSVTCMHFKVIGEGSLHLARIQLMHGDEQRALRLLEGHLQHTRSATLFFHRRNKYLHKPDPVVLAQKGIIIDSGSLEALGLKYGGTSYHMTSFTLGPFLSLSPSI